MKSFFPLINLHTIPHNDKAKIIYIYIFCFANVLRYKFGTPVFGEFLPFFSADPLKLCQVGWGASLHSYFQVSPEKFDRVQVRALAGLLKDIQRLVPKPLLCCLGCVHSVVVLLEGEPPPQSEVLSTLVLIKDLSVLCSIHLCINLDWSPSPCH
jgi:hypothetical protein